MPRVMSIYIPHQIWVKTVSKDKFLKRLLHAATFKAPKELKMKNTWLKKDVHNDLSDWVQLLRNFRANKIEFTLLEIEIRKQTKIDFDDTI